LTEIFDKNRYNGQRGGCNVSVGRYNNIKNTDLKQHLHPSTVWWRWSIKSEPPNFITLLTNFQNCFTETLGSK